MYIIFLCVSSVHVKLGQTVCSQYSIFSLLGELSFLALPPFDVWYRQFRVSRRTSPPTFYLRDRTLLQSSSISDYQTGLILRVWSPVDVPEIACGYGQQFRLVFRKTQVSTLNIVKRRV